MKTKTLLSILFLSMCISGFSQEHMKFKNIPIDGNVNDFSKELIKQGFTLSESLGNMIVLKGEFVGKLCKIYVVGSKKTHLTWKVYITFDKDNSWGSLKSKYNELKEQFAAKYGIGESFEFFSKPYFEGDGYETTALRLDKCTWSTFWKTEIGNVDISIENSQQIAISYQDVRNTDVMKQEKQEVISNDI